MGLRTLDDRFDAVHASDVARVDADRIRPVLDGRDRHPVIKMNIRHDRDVDRFFYFLK